MGPVIWVSVNTAKRPRTHLLTTSLAVIFNYYQVHFHPSLVWHIAVDCRCLLNPYIDEALGLLAKLPFLVDK